MFHHTGSYGETEMGIAHHSQLDLCSQCLVTREGVWVVCGVGIAYHGGVGGGIPGLWDPNEQMIGVEVAYDGGGTPGKPHRSCMSDVQYNSVATGFAAILNKLHLDPSRAIGHKEWAGRAQGKWDPGAIDMNVFRQDVRGLMDGGTTKGQDMWSETFKNFLGSVVSYGTAIFHIDRKLDELVRPWKQLGKNAKGEDLTLIDAVAEMKANIESMKTQLECLTQLHERGGKDS
jgi:hypothetical protein